MLYFKKRSDKAEIMDDLEMEGPELKATLEQIAWVNKLLGGLAISQAALAQLLQRWPKEKPLRLVDLGCGGGDALRAFALWGRKKGYRLDLLGIDANAYCLEQARLWSSDFPEIRYAQLDVFGEKFATLEFDIAHCALFLHHFEEEALDQLLLQLREQAQWGGIVNDLERSKLAHFLFRLVTKLLGASPMVRYDGLLSIQKSFLGQEWRERLGRLGYRNYRLRWAWAFRHKILWWK